MFFVEGVKILETPAVIQGEQQMSQKMESSFVNLCIILR